MIPGSASQDDSTPILATLGLLGIMHSAARDELFELGQLAADLLGRFVEIQDGLRSWRVIAFVPIGGNKQCLATRRLFFAVMNGTAVSVEKE
jgi:hypothetical protein